MKKYTIFPVSILFLLFLNSCKYDFILPEAVPEVNDVSFSQHVVPIFSAKCASCHKTGGTAPDLSAASTYAQIVPKYVNTSSPETSTIYAYISPATGTHSWKKYNASEAAIILQWITEGANDN